MYSFMNANEPSNDQVLSAGSEYTGLSLFPGQVPPTTQHFYMPSRNGYNQPHTVHPSWGTYQQHPDFMNKAANYDETPYLGQSLAPASHARPKLSTSFWEDQSTRCFQVDARGVCVSRREDNDMINGTKLLNVTGISRGKRDGILKNEKGRVVVKVGAMHLKGVWITMTRAKTLAAQFGITDILYPLFEDNIREFTARPVADAALSNTVYTGNTSMDASCQITTFYTGSECQSSPQILSPQTFQLSETSHPSFKGNTAATNAVNPMQDEPWTMPLYQGEMAYSSQLDERSQLMLHGGNQSSIISDSAPATPDVSMMQLGDQSAIPFPPLQYVSPSPRMYLGNLTTNLTTPCNTEQHTHLTNGYHFYHY